MPTAAVSYTRGPALRHRPHSAKSITVRGWEAGYLRELEEDASSFSALDSIWGKIHSFLKPSQTPKIEARGLSDDTQYYIASNPWLADLLSEAQREVTRIFGQDADVRCELHSDDDGSELFAIIHSSLTPERAFRALRQLDEEWLFHAPTRGRFNVDIEL